MKKHIFALLLAACLLCTACSKVEAPPVTEDTIETTISTEATFATAETTMETATQTEETLPPANGGTGMCGIHAELYHSYPQPWIDYVGTEAFMTWNQTEHDTHGPDENGCPYPTTNAYTFIHTFDYPKERFIEEYDTHPWIDYDYQVDLLYGDDSAAVEYYYRVTYLQNQPKQKEIMLFRQLKHKLYNLYPDKLEGLDNWKEHSLLEMLEIVGIDLSDAQALTAQDASLNEDLPLRFDAVATMSADEQKELMSAHSAFYQDCVLLGETPYETPYEKQVADNAAAGLEIQ
jgi:hypothetical protein